MAGVNKDEILATARKIAEKAGLDVDGRVRLRSENKSDAIEEEEAE
jgi:hypothetical protein